MAVVGAWGLGWCLGHVNGVHMDTTLGEALGWTNPSNEVQEEGVKGDGCVGL